MAEIRNTQILHEGDVTHALKVKKFSMCYVMKEKNRQQRTNAVHDLTFDFGVDLAVESGKCKVLGIVGNSGSGKSSLLHAIQHYGQVKEQTREHALTQTRDKTKSSIEYQGEIVLPEGRTLSIMQDPKAVLNPLKTIRKSFLELVYSKQYPHEKKLQEVEIIKYLEMAGLEGEIKRGLLSKRPHQLSGGMAQRVMIAIVFAMHPTLLLADEFSASLDLEKEVQIMNILMKHVPSMILVTHRLHLIRKYCTRVMFLEKGALLWDGSVDDFLQSNRDEVQSFIANISLTTQRSQQGKDMYE